MEILVTGGTGYIGSHTVVELFEAGYTPIIADNLSNSEISVLEGIEKITHQKCTFYQIDVCDKTMLKKLFHKHPNIKGVIHFAASKAVGESVANPLKYYRNNLDSLITLMEVMIEHDVQNLVFSSSCTVYGQPVELPVRESSPVLPALSPYGNTKQIAEEIISDTVQAHKNLKGIALRYFNPIGAHYTGFIGELPLGVPANLVPFITQCAIGLRDKIQVFGNDYNTPDGTAIRDYIHVVDLAKAHVVALNRMIDAKQKNDYEVFNIGTGQGLSVLEIIETFMKVNNITIPYTIVDRRPGDIEKVWADTSFANTELGWKAKLGIEEMLVSAWKWEQYCRNGKNKQK